LLSLAHLTVLDVGPLALIDAAAAGGFDAIGLRIEPTSGAWASCRFTYCVASAVTLRAGRAGVPGANRSGLGHRRATPPGHQKRFYVG
jgi:hypothetical protein